MKTFFIGVPFVIHTDHQPLIYLHNIQIIVTRLDRRLEDLAAFNYEIRCTPGKHNCAADCLSHLYETTGIHQHCSSVVVVPNVIPYGLIPLQEIRGGADMLFESLLVLSQKISLERVPPDHPQNYGSCWVEISEEVVLIVASWSVAGGGGNLCMV